MLFLLAGCSPSATTPAPVKTGVTNESSATPPILATATPTLAASRTLPPASVTPALLVSPTPSPLPSDLSITTDQLLVYPSGAIFEGDSVTFQVWAHLPQRMNASQVDVEIRVDQNLVASGNISPRLLGGDLIGHMALFPWTWNTSGQPGLHQVKVRLDPDDVIQAGDENPNNNEIALPLLVQPAAASTAEAKQWVRTDVSCCVIYVVSDSAAHRDLDMLQQTIEDAVAQAATTIQVTPERQLEIFFVDRVIGQGGYSTGHVIVISYLDRLYSGSSIHEVSVHEAVHALDALFAPQRTSFLAEGVAVWAAGGHYKQEQLDQRVAALVELDLYVPLTELMNDFILSQHEIGYLQAGGFIDYLVQNYGWEHVRAFYADTAQEDGTTPAAAVDLNLRAHFQKSLATIESEWLAYLKRIRPREDVGLDLATTVRYYDIMRLYQERYDPAAHFLRAWLPSPLDMVGRGTTAELTRHPTEDINVTLEVMLIDADEAVRSRNYSRANVILDSIERTMAYQGTFLDPLGNNYYHIVRALAADGYQAQRVNLRGNRATVRARLPNQLNLAILQMVLNSQEWILTQ